MAQLEKPTYKRFRYAYDMLFTTTTLSDMCARVNVT